MGRQAALSGKGDVDHFWMKRLLEIGLLGIIEFDKTRPMMGRGQFLIRVICLNVHLLGY